MSPHARFGQALYEPPLSLNLKPGSVGYFDDSGSRKPIVQLSQGAQTLLDAGYTALEEELERAEDDEDITWRPKCSNGVKGVVEHSN
jgi:hypothetical protein